MKLPAIGGMSRSRKLLLVGLVVVIAGMASLLGSIYKPQLQTWFADGEYRAIRLPANNFLIDNVSVVKVAGVDVGTVDDVVRQPNGTAKVTVKVSDAALRSVGSQPTAALRPHTLLGGKYYIEVRPGGDRESEWTEPIPLERTRLPVEVDDIAQTLQPDALDGATTAVRQFNETLGAGGDKQLRRLLGAAPDTLAPGAKALAALRGTSPNTDLTQLVSGLDATAEVLTRREGQLQAILSDMDTTTSALADGSGALAASVDRMPATLDTVSAGMRHLRNTLRTLRNTAGPARPTVRELGATLRTADPVFERAVPVMRDLRVAMAGTRPLLRELVPVSARGTKVLNRLDGPVLDRINGPIKHAVLTPFHGTGPYRHTSGDAPFYQELGYMFSGLNATGAYVDDNGHFVAFQPGGGIGTVSGVGPMTLEQMFQHLFHGKEQR